MTPSRPCRVLAGLLLALVCGLAAGAAEDEAAPYVREHRPARLVIEGLTRRGERVELSLSGTVQVTLTVEDGPGLEVEVPQAITTSEGWGVRSAGPAQTTALPGGGRRWEQRFLLEPARPGELPLAVAPLRYRESAGPWKTVTWEPVPVQVTTEVSGADLKQLHDIRGPIMAPEPPPWPRWPWAAALAVVVVGAGLVLWHRRRRRRPETPPPAPREWALQELARLEALDQPGRGEVNRYHTLLSDILRRYLELRFQLHAPRQTTAEFLQSPETTRQLGPARQELLRGFLQRCDLAKFAGVTPSPEQCRALAEVARSFLAEADTPSASPAPQS